MLCMLNIEEQIPPDHLLHEIKKLADGALKRMDRAFGCRYGSL